MFLFFQSLFATNDIKIEYIEIPNVDFFHKTVSVRYAAPKNYKNENRDAIVFMGATNFLEERLPFLTQLLNNGYNPFCVELPGHGKSGNLQKQGIHVDSFDDYLKVHLYFLTDKFFQTQFTPEFKIADFTAVIEQGEARIDPKFYENTKHKIKATLFGISLGAGLALRLFQKYETHMNFVFDHVALITPPINVTQYLPLIPNEAVKYAINIFRGCLPYSLMFYRGLSKKQMIDRAVAYPEMRQILTTHCDKIRDGFTVTWLSEFLAMIDHLLEFRASLPQNTFFILASTDDKICNQCAAKFSEAKKIQRHYCEANHSDIVWKCGNEIIELMKDTGKL